MLSRSVAPKVAPPAKRPSKAPAASRPPVPTAPARPTTTTTTPKAPAPAAPPSTAVRATPPSANSHVQVSLVSIAAALPESLSHKVSATAGQTVAIPADRVISQLAQGAVMMTAAELRVCAPEHFAFLEGHDEVTITLPLADIVKQLSPAHFARREQKCVEVPTNVGPVFAAGGSGVSVSKPGAQPAPAAQPQPAASATTAPAAAPATSGSAKISMSAQAMAALSGKPAASGPAPAASAAARPSARPAPAAPAAAAAPRNTATSLPKMGANGAATVSGPLLVPVASVCADWAKEVRSQLVGVPIDDSHIHVPLELLEPAMKSGKVLFTWREVASWIQPALAAQPTAPVGEVAVELPLKIIAPLFMAHHRGSGQKRIAVDETIPDLFGEGVGNSSMQAQVSPATQHVAAPAPAPQPAPARSSSPARPSGGGLRLAPGHGLAAAAAKPAAAAPAAAPVPADNGATLEQVIGAAGKRFGAKEIVANTVKLPGVTGALLLMSDGLLVTSQAPASVKAETIAAFIPQMFGRMNQYTKELALGPLQQLTLGVEGGQWHVMKSATIYFAVLGKHGETLSLNLLAQVAAELSSQSN